MPKGGAGSGGGGPLRRSGGLERRPAGGRAQGALVRRSLGRAAQRPDHRHPGAGARPHQRLGARRERPIGPQLGAAAARRQLPAPGPRQRRGMRATGVRVATQLQRKSGQHIKRLLGRVSSCRKHIHQCSKQEVTQGRSGSHHESGALLWSKTGKPRRDPRASPLRHPTPPAPPPAHNRHVENRISQPAQ